MSIWTGAVLLPLLGAMLHPLLGWAIQRAARAGVGMILLAGISGILTAVVTLVYRQPDGPLALKGLDYLALANGVAFFFGQWFSILSVRNGNLGVHSSVLGVKLLVVAALSVGMGLESGSPTLLIATLLATIAVFLVAGASWSGLRQHRHTVLLTLVACLFFGVNDYLTGQFGASIGTSRWMALMFGSSGLLSVFLVLSRRRQARELARSRTALGFVLLAGLCLGVQAVLVNVAFSEFRQPALSNVAYSSRGVMAVVALFLLGGAKGREQWRRKLAGSLLMVLALGLAVSD
ncbi:MAG: hypothetical protein AAGI48_18215 [Verrucomicrobiota bacterium]